MQLYLSVCVWYWWLWWCGGRSGFRGGGGGGENVEEIRWREQEKDDECERMDEEMMMMRRRRRTDAGVAQGGRGSVIDGLTQWWTDSLLASDSSARLFAVIGVIATFQLRVSNGGGRPTPKQ